MELITVISFCAMLLLIPARYYGNRYRGKANEDQTLTWVTKPMVYACWALLMYVSCIQAILSYTWDIVPYMAMFLFFVCEIVHYQPGWGKWYPHVRNTNDEVEGLVGKYLVDPLTVFTLGYYPNNYTHPDMILRYKTLAFGLRFSLCAIPKYVLLSLLTHSFVPLIGILFMLSAGPIYLQVFRKPGDPLEESEHWTGLMVGTVDFGILLYLLIQFQSMTS